MIFKSRLHMLLRQSFWMYVLPYFWMLLFVVVPFLFILKISFSQVVIAIPPYSLLTEYTDQILKITLDLSNYIFLFTDDLYVASFLDSLKISFISTLWCALLGYPIAYGIARTQNQWRHFLLMLVVLPSWTSFLIRIYAWMGILKNNGFLNQFLLYLGLIHEPLKILNTTYAVYIGIVYSYLPFMILPLYANFMKLDLSLVHAALDLGARPWKAFWTITFPLSRSGMIAGSTLVFIPVVGEVVIPELLGGPDTLMIGKVLWQEFFYNRDWPLAASVAIAMLVVLLVPMAIFNRFEKTQFKETT